MIPSPFLSQPDRKVAPTEAPIQQRLSSLPRVYHALSDSFFQKAYKKVWSLACRVLGKPDPYGVIPVTVITGFLGSGKTTIIINLMKLLPKSYRVAWLKNEFGSTAVDSELAKDNNIATVKEMLSGCLCHVLVGQFSQALEDLIATKPDRIIIETSGSSHPANLVWEIKKHPRLVIDGVIDVIDAKNFHGYKDKSFSAKLQAEYNDLILINKHEGLDERALDTVLDDVYELNVNVPKIKTDRGVIDPNLIFGIDLGLFSQANLDPLKLEHLAHDHQATEVDLVEMKPQGTFSDQELATLFKHYPADHFYRIKGVLQLAEGWGVVNFAFGEYTIFPLASYRGEQKMIFMGEGLQPFFDDMCRDFRVALTDVRFTPKGHHHEHNHKH